MFHRATKIAIAVGAAGLGIASFSAAAAVTSAAPRPHVTKFSMVRSGGLVATPKCIPRAGAVVTVRPTGQVEVMDVKAFGLPKNTDFDLFVIQKPNAKFGVSWYQGDLETGRNGTGEGQYVGRFSVETFAVAPGAEPAPLVHSAPPFPDATTNPVFAPIHTYHLGLWFNSPNDAKKAGCPTAVTPFNGEHNAGVQALNTGNFPDNFGPLRQVKS